MDKEHFLTEVESRLRSIMNASKILGKALVVEKYRCQGFMKAGVVLGISTNSELQQLIEAVHFDIFGQTIKEREQARTSVWKEEEIDYNQYEISPLLRDQ